MRATPADRENVQRRDVVINLRAPAQARDLIDKAAKLTGKTRTEFVLDSARRCAEEVLLDQRLFIVDEEHFHRFLNLLDKPPRPAEELKKLLAAKAPWEK